MPCSDLRSGSFTRRSLPAHRRGHDAPGGGRRHQRRLPGSRDPAVPHLAEGRTGDGPSRARRAPSGGRSSRHMCAHGPRSRVLPQGRHRGPEAAAGHATSNPAEGIARNPASTIGRSARPAQFAAHFVVAGGSFSSWAIGVGEALHRDHLERLRRALRGPRRGSPSGTRKTSAPDSAAPIAFCSAPPIGCTLPPISSAPVTATRRPSRACGRSARSRPRARTRGRRTGPRRRRSSTSPAPAA